MKRIKLVAILIASQSFLQAQSGKDSIRLKRNVPKIVMTQIAEAEKEWMWLWNQGPTNLTWDKMPLQAGDKSPDFELESSTNKTTRLSDLWGKEPILLIFWRHNGCGCGFARADELIKNYNDIKKLGVNVVIINQAEPERSAFYAKERGLKGILLSDPDYKVYKAFGLLDGKAPQILGTPSIDFTIGKGLQEARKNTQRALVDNPWLLPGEFIIDKTGTIRFIHRYSTCDDFPQDYTLKAELESVIKNKS